MTDEPQRHLTLSWTLDSPRADVFRAWTDPDHLQWFYNPAQPIPDDPIELDLRVGGVWRQRMVISEKTDYVTGGVYREIVRDEKLVFNWGAAGGWPELDPERLEESPLVTVTLTEVGGQTEMSLRVDLPAGLAPDQVQAWWSTGVRDGWRDTVDRLAAALESAAPVS
jgi:uncharacterized protein YndB with AHSA1/START domain